MLIGTVAVDESKTFEIEKPLQSVAVSFEMDDAALQAAETKTAILAAIATNIADAVVSVAYRDRDGARITPYNNIPLLALLEANQMEEGQITIEHQAANVYEFTGVFNLSDMGAISFNDDETMELTVDVKNAKTGAISLYSIESPVLAGDFNYITKLSVEDGKTEKVFNVSAYDRIMVPRTALTATLKLDMHYTNGMTTRHIKQDLEIIGNTINDVCYGGNSKHVSGFGHWVILSVGTVREIEINRSSTTAFDIYALESRVVNGLKRVAKINQKLVPTTAAKYEEAARKQNL
jgi:hypothetical protein